MGYHLMGTGSLSLRISWVTVVSNIFYVHPNFGEDSHFDQYFFRWFETDQFLIDDNGAITYIMWFNFRPNKTLRQIGILDIRRGAPLLSHSHHAMSILHSRRTGQQKWRQLRALERENRQLREWVG